MDSSRPSGQGPKSYTTTLVSDCGTKTASGNSGKVKRLTDDTGRSITLLKKTLPTEHEGRSFVGQGAAGEILEIKEVRTGEDVNVHDVMAEGALSQQAGAPNAPIVTLVKPNAERRAAEGDKLRIVQPLLGGEITEAVDVLRRRSRAIPAACPAS